MSSLRSDDIQGGQYFDSWERRSPVEDNEELLSVYPDQAKFQKIRTIPVTIIIMIIVVLQVIGIFCVSYIHSLDSGHDLAICVYIHVCFWFLLMLGDRLLRVLHNRSRNAGYLTFYRQTRVARRTPIIISSCANAVMLLLVVLLNDYCDNNSDKNRNLHHRHYSQLDATPSPDMCKQISPLHKTSFVQIIVCLESIAILAVLTFYLVRCIQFNRRKPNPDVLNDEIHTATSGHTQDVGYRESDHYEDMLERQADLIGYLKQHNADLAKQLAEQQQQAEHQQQPSV